MGSWNLSHKDDGGDDGDDDDSDELVLDDPGSMPCLLLADGKLDTVTDGDSDSDAAVAVVAAAFECRIQNTESWPLSHVQMVITIVMLLLLLLLLLMDTEYRVKNLYCL